VFFGDAHHPTEYLEVLADAQVRVESQILRHETKRSAGSRISAGVTTVEHDSTAVGGNSAARGSEQSGFSGAVRAEQDNEFTRSHLEIDRVEHLALAELFADTFEV
jgi:hypothetical protein